MSVEILVVEDNPGEVRLIQEAFKAVEYATTMRSVTTAREALEFLGAVEGAEAVSTPDFLLLDLNLAEGAGFEVLDALREQSNRAWVPVIVLTNSKAEEDIRRSYERRANAYVTKPSSPDEYEALARTLIDFWVDVNLSPPA